MKDIQEIMEEPWFIPTVVGVTASVGGFLAGLVVGLRVGYEARVKDEEEKEQAKNIINTEVTEVTEQISFEFDSTVDDPRLLDKFERISDPQFRAEVAASRDRVVERDRKRAEMEARDPNPRNDPRDIVVDDLESREVFVGIEDVIEVVVEPANVFDTEFDHWDYKEEVPLRTKDKPYIIHRDEFWGEEENYDQTTLTYYAEDDILTDQEDTPIYGYESVTGKLLFGHGSGDINTVYIRNDKQSAEYEVLRVDGAYSREILGVSLEEDSERSDLKHSVRKFRPRDD